jgi:hypothetical protein
MLTIDLFAFDGETVIASIEKLDDFMAAGLPIVIVWGTRAFARNADGQYIQVSSADQAAAIPVGFPLPALGATN